VAIFKGKKKKSTILSLKNTEFVTEIFLYQNIFWKNGENSNTKKAIGLGLQLFTHKLVPNSDHKEP
jgi:hypothetical protein